MTDMQDTQGMVFDLNGVDEEAAGFDALPKGVYDAEVESWEFGDSAKGTPMISVVYNILSGEFENRKIYDYYVLEGEGAKFALPKIKQLINRCKPEVDLASFNPKEIEESGIMIGTPCRLDLNVQTQKKGEYAGQKQNRVKEILAPGDAAGTFLG